MQPEYLHLHLELNLKHNNIARTKCKDFIFSSNFPYLLGTSAFSNWTNMIGEKIFNLSYMLGYSSNYTRLLDCGGTAFSDALLNYKYTISKNELPHILYDKIDQTADFKLYKNKISIPFGISVSNKLSNLSYENPFQYQNEIYQELFNENLIDIIPFSNEVAITEKSILYACV